MQCVSCRFENMPGVATCGRCGSSLRVATAVLDVHPPRARPWAKKLRRILPVGRAGYRLRDTAVEFQRRASRVADEVRIPLPTWNVMARFVVPGWAQMFLGQRLRGRIFLAAYAALFLLGLAMWGSIPGSILLGLAFSVHASSVLDALFFQAGPFPSRLGTAGLVMLVLSLLVYAPAYWVVSRVASPMGIMVPMDPFHVGDVVLANHWAYYRTPPRAGDVVAYQLPRYMPTVIDHVATRVLTGQSIDRILAGPGSEVRWEKNQLYVDNEPSELKPLNPARVPSQLIIKVPEGHYLILPSTATVSLPANTALPNGTWQKLACVPAGQIEGTVYLRHYPFWRIWFIR